MTAVQESEGIPAGTSVPRRPKTCRAVCEARLLAAVSARATRRAITDAVGEDEDEGGEEVSVEELSQNV